MALIKCGECGHGVSSTASSCPNCGYSTHSTCRNCKYLSYGYDIPWCTVRDIETDPDRRSCLAYVKEDDWWN